jgi:hypothetical protein
MLISTWMVSAYHCSDAFNQAKKQRDLFLLVMSQRFWDRGCVERWLSVGVAMLRR